MENFEAGEMLRRKEAARAYGKIMKDDSKKNQTEIKNEFKYSEKEILELAKKGGFSPEKLKKVYRELAKENHPDKLDSQNLTEEEKNEREEKMKTINERYRILSEKL